MNKYFFSYKIYIKKYDSYNIFYRKNKNDYYFKTLFMDNAFFMR